MVLTPGPGHGVCRRSLGCLRRQPRGLRDGPGRPATYLPAAAAVVLPADHCERRFAGGAEAAGLVRDPLGRVCENDSGGRSARGSGAGAAARAGGLGWGRRLVVCRSLRSSRGSLLARYQDCWPGAWIGPLWQQPAGRPKTQSEGHPSHPLPSLSQPASSLAGSSGKHGG